MSVQKQNKSSNSPARYLRTWGFLLVILVIGAILPLLLNIFPGYLAVLIMFSGLMLCTLLYFRRKRIDVPLLGWLCYAIGWLAAVLLILGQLPNEPGDVNSQLATWLGLGLASLDVILIGSAYFYRKSRTNGSMQ
jgi:hypothetical protein